MSKDMPASWKADEAGTLDTLRRCRAGMATLIERHDEARRQHLGRRRHRRVPERRRGRAMRGRDAAGSCPSPTRGLPEPHDG